MTLSRNLETQINITENVEMLGSTEGSCDQQAFETDMNSSQANTHSRTAYTEKLSALTADNTKLKAQATGKMSSGPSTLVPKSACIPGMLQISKLVANSKPQWKPTGRHFSLFEKYPLTRIMEPTDMPLELPPSASSSPQITMVSRASYHVMFVLSHAIIGYVDIKTGWTLSSSRVYTMFETQAQLFSVGQFCDGGFRIFTSLLAYKSLFNEVMVMASSVESSEFRDIERIGSEKSSQRITHAEI
ncbi:hypothetical protein Tco_1317166 [Tanacetum coccineum]